MKKLVLVVVAVAFAACAPKATKEECTATCGKLAAMETAGAVKADAVKQAQEAAQAKIAAFAKEKTDALAKLEADCAKKKGPKPKLAKELATKKDALSKEFATKEAALTQENADALKAAGEEQAKAAAAQAEAAKKTEDECVAQCEGQWSKMMLECQAKATKVEEFQACK